MIYLFQKELHPCWETQHNQKGITHFHYVCPLLGHQARTFAQLSPLKFSGTRTDGNKHSRSNICPADFSCQVGLYVGCSQLSLQISFWPSITIQNTPILIKEHSSSTWWFTVWQMKSGLQSRLVAKVSFVMEASLITLTNVL